MKPTNWNLGWMFIRGNHWMPREAYETDLPHDFVLNLPRSRDNPGGISTGYTGGDAAVYEKKLLIEPDDDSICMLNFDGIYERAEIYVGDELMAQHPYGYTPLTVDLSGALKPGENRIRVRCCSYQPASRWYTGGGIYRSVTLWKGPKVFIHPDWVFVTTPRINTQAAEVQLQARIVNATPQPLAGSMKAEICLQGVAVACGSTEATLKPGDNEVHLSVSVPEPQLWSLEDPQCYEARIHVTADGRTDTHATRFGIRTIEIDARQGFRLNGVPMKLRGGCIHHDNGMLGAAAFPRAEERKIGILKKAGFNAIRTAHNPPSQALLDACDRLGMLVLAESFDCWRLGKTPLDYHMSFEQWWQADTRAMVLGGRNHPSVFCWSIGNEIMEFGGNSQGVAYGKLQADFVRQLDPTRPVTSGINCAVGRPEDFFAGWSFPRMNQYVNEEENGVFHGEDRFDRDTQAAIANLDIAGYNYHFRRFGMDQEKYPDRVIMETESRPALTWACWQAVKTHSNAIGDFVWVAMDNLGEAGSGQVHWSDHVPEKLPWAGWPWLSCFQGDHDLCGNRLPISYYRETVWGLNKGVHLFTRHPMRYGMEPYGNGWHWDELYPSWTYGAEWQGKPIVATAYTTAEQVDFYVNDRLAASVPVEKCIARCDLSYEPGTLRAVAIRQGKPIGQDELKTGGAAAQLVLQADRTSIAADRQDLCYIRVQVADDAGIPLMADDVDITVEVTGPAVLQGLGSGQPCTEENFGTGHRLTFRGSVTAVIRGLAPGTAFVRFAAAGLRDAQCTIHLEQRGES